ncbi:MAG: nucleotidyltransferase family protein [Dehalococcoidia bacterium]
MTDFTARRWPAPAQTDLLRAALLPREEALAAWARWKAAVDFEEADAASHDLGPLVARNLLSLGCEDELLPRLKGVQRRTWYRNRILLHAATGAARHLQEAGIPTMLLKGAPLAHRYYGDISLRPMADVDLLVPTAEATRAADLLMAAGWVPQAPRKRVYDFIRLFHAIGMDDRAGGSVDLHWHVLEECCTAGADREFWDAATDLEIEGTTFKTLHPSDLLLHVCVHGSRGYPAPTLRWIPDALTILQGHGDAFDWDRLVAQAKRRNLTLATSNALEYLVAYFRAPIPETVISRLRTSRPTLVERLDYRAQGSRDTTLWSVVRDTTRYARLSAGRPLHRRVAGFPVYLQQLWGLPSAWQAPGEGALRVWRRLRGRRTPQPLR